MASFDMLFILLVAMFLKCGHGEDATEADLMALEASGQLLAPKTLILKIADELKAIRYAYPEVANIVHVARWGVGELMAKVSDKQLEQIRSEYGEVTLDPLFDDYKTLIFTTPYNPEVLANELISKELLETAEPNFTIGDGDNVEYNVQTATYTFKQGWGDCLEGCAYNHYWEFSVLPTGVNLLKEYGSPLMPNSQWAW